MEDSVLSDRPAPLRVSLQPVYLALTFIFGILIGVGGLFGYQEYISVKTAVTTYDECIKTAGSRIQESYPATCITRDGKRFTQPTMDDDGVNPIYTDPFSCSTNDDCVTGIQISGCCVCPEPINKTEIGKNDWETYTPGKDYSNKSTCKTLVACQPCEAPTKPVCRDNQCVFDNGTPAVPPTNDYTCPKTEWVDCMPGPLEGKSQGIKFECADEFITWAKANCPDFQGATY